VLVQSLVVREHKPEQELASEVILVVMTVLVLRLKPERVELSRKHLVKHLVSKKKVDAAEVEVEFPFPILSVRTEEWNVLIGHVLDTVPVDYITCT